MWLGVDLRMDNQKDMCLEEIGLCAQSMITILGATINIIGGGGCMSTL